MVESDDDEVIAELHRCQGLDEDTEMLERLHNYDDAISFSQLNADVQQDIHSELLVFDAGVLPYDAYMESMFDDRATEEVATESARQDTTSGGVDYSVPLYSDPLTSLNTPSQDLPTSDCANSDGGDTVQSAPIPDAVPSRKVISPGDTAGCGRVATQSSSIAVVDGSEDNLVISSQDTRTLEIIACDGAASAQSVTTVPDDRCGKVRAGPVEFDVTMSEVTREQYTKAKRKDLVDWGIQMYEAWEVREAQFASVVHRNEALKHQNDTMRRMLHDYRNDFTEESWLRQQHRVILADMKRYREIRLRDAEIISKHVRRREEMRKICNKLRARVDDPIKLSDEDETKRSATKQLLEQQSEAILGAIQTYMKKRSDNMLFAGRKCAYGCSTCNKPTHRSGFYVCTRCQRSYKNKYEHLYKRFQKIVNHIQNHM